MSLFTPGHSACAGCALPIAVRKALEVFGKNTIVVNATGCLEIVSTDYPHTAWCVPYIHSLFENAAAVASGIEAALKKLGKNYNVLAIAGDGGTVDIGLQALSGAFERMHRICFICVDNEAYMNTGIQRSSATPYGAWTTTSPPGKLSIGKKEWKKDMPFIAAAHKIPYVATASIAYLHDYEAKLKKAKEKMPSYIHVHCPCPTGWRFPSSKTIEVAKLAVESGMWVLYEIEDGKLRITYKPKELKSVKDYLALQGRFKHLNAEDIRKIEETVKKEWKRLVEIEESEMVIF